MFKYFKTRSMLDLEINRILKESKEPVLEQELCRLGFEFLVRDVLSQMLYNRVAFYFNGKNGRRWRLY